MKPTGLSLFCGMLLTCTILGTGLQAQDLEESNFMRYTRLEGLSNNYISGIVQDSTGYIWIATHKGMNRFDGKLFQTVYKNSSRSPLPDNLLKSLRKMSSNEIIGATRAGAFSFDPVSGGSKKFLVPCDSTIFFWENNVFDIIKDNHQNYIVSTKTGLYIFNDSGRLVSRYDYHLPEDVGKKEMIFGGWVNSFENGYTLQQNGLYGSLYDPFVNRIDTLYVAKKDFLRKMMTDSGGEMRMACSGRKGELYIFNNDRNSIDIADLYSPEYYSSPMPFSVRADLGWSSKLYYINDSLLAITCRNNGFYLFNLTHNRQLICDGKKYFSKEVCTTVFRDREGRFWVGTTDGLYKQNLHNTFFSVTDLAHKSPDLADHDIRCIYIEKNTIYAGLQNEGGLLIMDKKTGAIRKRILFSPAKTFSNSVTNIIPFSRDTLWISTTRGILWLKIGSNAYGLVKPPPQLAWIQQVNSRTFFIDSKKNIWISFANLNSVVRYDQGTRSFTNISTESNPLLKLTYVFSMSEDLQGNIWLAGDGLCRWNTTKQMVDTLIPYPKVSKLLLNYMFILDRDSSNNLWLSSFDNEVIQYNCSTHAMYLRQPENNIIDGNTVTSSAIIRDNIWMGTDNGISAFNIRDFSVKQFTYADGLPSVAITTTGRGSFYDRESDRFYLGARYRLISFSPDISYAQKVSPLLFIEKITTRDSVIQSFDKPIRLKYAQNNLTIIFNTINFTDPEENRFAWRPLDGNDTSWIELSEQTPVTLTNLSGGNHAVQVKLYSANNHWPQQVKTIKIYIQPPFWKMPWFIAMMAVLIAAVVFIIYKNRVNSIRRKERENAKVQQLIAEEYKNQFELEQITNYFSSSIAGKNNVEDVLWDVTKNLIGRMNYEDCIIYLWNKDRTKMEQKAAFGPKGNPKIIKMSAFDVAPGQGVVGHVMMTGESLLIPNTMVDHRYRVDDMERLSELCVPIIHNDELIGIIDSEHPDENHFKERDVKILTTIATLVGNKLKQIESEESLAKKQMEISLINQQLAEAQLSALQTQMNPHFIFNSLNSIKGMILDNNQKKASRYLSKFAHMIRMTLNQSREVFTTLHENLQHLENYLEMEKLRFDDSFTYKIVVSNCIDKEETLIPTLMIQPLTENAIWHGLMQMEGEKKLLICFSQLDDTICCTIEDNGIGIKKSEELKFLNKPAHQSVGLSNLRHRIKIMNEKYDVGCSLEINDLTEQDAARTGTCAILRFNIITNKIFL